MSVPTFETMFTEHTRDYEPGASVSYRNASDQLEYARLVDRKELESDQSSWRAVRFLTHAQTGCGCQGKLHSITFELFCTDETVLIPPGGLEKRVLIFAPWQFEALPLPQDDAANRKAYTPLLLGRVLRRQGEFFCRLASDAQRPDQLTFLDLDFSFHYLEQKVLGTLPGKEFWQAKKMALLVELQAHFCELSFDLTTDEVSANILDAAATLVRALPKDNDGKPLPALRSPKYRKYDGLMSWIRFVRRKEEHDTTFDAFKWVKKYTDRKEAARILAEMLAILVRSLAKPASSRFVRSEERPVETSYGVPGFEGSRPTKRAKEDDDVEFVPSDESESSSEVTAFLSAVLRCTSSSEEESSEESSQKESEEEESEEEKPRPKNRSRARSVSATVGQRWTKKLKSTSEEKQSSAQDHLERFHCTECTATYTSKLQLESHLQKHKDGKLRQDLLCEKCGRLFSVLGNLKAHMRTHTGEKPFKCSTCGYKFSRNGDLKIHMRTHTGEKPFKCSTCGYKCSRSSMLKDHVRTHTGEKPFKCSTCGYKCSRSGTLKDHVRTHTGEKPFKCSTCGYKCSQSGSLKVHMITHTGEKPFKCSTCGYKCSYRRALKLHMRTHTGKKPFKC
eukprot:g79181.t1